MPGGSYTLWSVTAKGCSEFFFLTGIYKPVTRINGLPWWLRISKESTCNAGDLGSIPELGRSPGEGNGYPLQYFCLENSTDRGAWQTTVHRVEKSQIWLTLSLYKNKYPKMFGALLIKCWASQGDCFEMDNTNSALYQNKNIPVWRFPVISFPSMCQTQFWLDHYGCLPFLPQFWTFLTHNGETKGETRRETGSQGVFLGVSWNRILTPKGDRISRCGLGEVLPS